MATKQQRKDRRRVARTGLGGPIQPVRLARQPLDDLQRMAGNGAVARLMSDNPTVVGESSIAERQAEAAEGGQLAAAVHTPRGSSGSPLPGHIRRKLETGRGVDLSGVRVHTDPAAGLLADSLGAEALTRGGDIFFAPGRYSPDTTEGGKLLAHEVAHSTQHDAASVHLKRTKKHLDFVRMKRKDTKIARMLTAKALGAVGAKSLADRVEPGDAYGHWWVETGHLSADGGTWLPTQSYGWWPQNSVSIAQTLKIDRVEGQLNQGGATDPHHGEAAEEEFHPVMEVDDKDSYDTVRKQVTTDIDSFAHAFKGSWNWRLAWGKNCHTFQDRMKKQLHLHNQKVKPWLKDPAGDATLKAKADEDAKAQFLHRWRMMKDIGDMILVNPEMMKPDPMYDLSEMQALTDEDKQAIVDFIGCKRQTMSDWCSWHYMRAGDGIFT